MAVVVKKNKWEVVRGNKGDMWLVYLNGKEFWCLLKEEQHMIPIILVVNQVVELCLHENVFKESISDLENADELDSWTEENVILFNDVEMIINKRKHFWSKGFDIAEDPTCFCGKTWWPIANTCSSFYKKGDK